MRTFHLDDGSVLPLVRRIPGAPDPLALFDLLTGDAPNDTLLLESADATTRQGERSILITRAAVRLECFERTARYTALTPNGRSALLHISRMLGDRAVRTSPTTIEASWGAMDIGISEEERLAATSPFEAVRALGLRWTLVSRPAAIPLLVAGVFAYEALDLIEELPAPAGDGEFPRLYFVLPEQIITIDHRQKTTTVITPVYGGEHAGAVYHDATAEIDRLTRIVSSLPSSDVLPPASTPPRDAANGASTDIDDGAFEAIVARLQQHIVAGDVFQIVPSRRFTLPCSSALTAYAQLRSLNPSPYMFVARSPSWTLFGASPETCVRVSGSPARVEIRPIAGTAARGRRADGSVDADLDGRLEAELRTDSKELAEHIMLVDLARNDVARVCVPGSRHVPRLLAVDRYSHVMHLVSYVEGELRPDLDVMHAYAASMNMGTVVGAPKLKAAELLRGVEPTLRGPYGGAIGYITADGQMDTALVIRSALVRDGQAHVRAGAGVVNASRPASEALETRRKANAVLQAIVAAEEAGR
jgi:anthranilate synthase component 1